MAEKNRNKPDLTKEQVFESAEKLYKEKGEIPRQQDIKDDIGGSISTIQPWLKEWRAFLAKREAAVNEVPDYVRDGAIQMAALLWQDLELATNQQIEAIHKFTQQKIEEAQQDVKDNLVEIKRLEKVEKNVVEERIKAQEEIKEAKEQVQKKDLELATVTADRNSLKQQLSEKKNDNKRMNDMLLQFGLKNKEETNPTSKPATKVKP